MSINTIECSIPRAMCNRIPEAFNNYVFMSDYRLYFQ